MENIFVKYASALYESGALNIKKDTFKLRSGGLSHIYLDHRTFITKASNFKILVDVYSELIGQCSCYDSICSMDSVCSPLITGALSIKYETDLIITKEKNLVHGKKQQIWHGKPSNTICVDDIITSGSLLLKTIDLLQKNNLIVIGTIAPIIRNERFITDNPDVNVVTLGSIRDLFNIIRNMLSEEERRIIEKEGF